VGLGGGGGVNHAQVQHTVHGHTGNSQILFVSDFFSTILQVHFQMFSGHILAQIPPRDTHMGTFHLGCLV
jgi:hypothetical protein